jgi:glutamine amidotransferase
MKKIAIIDYGGGNIGSVINAINRLGYKPAVTDDSTEVLKAYAVFLPGVGAAGDTMKNLSAKGMADTVRKLVEEKRPLFAICVGLQVLFDSTEEGGNQKCLGIIPGKVKGLAAGLKIPHMGWNQVKQIQAHTVFTGIPDNTNFYFVHSYYADPLDKTAIAGVTEYGIPFCSMVIKDNLFATQFHPEKSGELGLKMYDNFIKLACA